MAEVIVALDTPSGRKALQVVDALGDARWAKVGSVLFTAEGPAVVRELRSRGINVFLDLKWHDIPQTVGDAVAAASALDVQLVSVHALGGPAMLAAAVRRAEGGPAVVAATALTSHDPAELAVVLGRGVPDLGVEVLRLARLAVAGGCRGVVASPHEVAALREVLGTEPWLVVPGIRRATDSRDDQVRAGDPAVAARTGATFLVVGRPITGAPDPRAAFAEFRELAAW